MSLSASEKLEVIRIVEESELSVRRTFLTFRPACPISFDDLQRITRGGIVKTSTQSVLDTLFPRR